MSLKQNAIKIKSITYLVTFFQIGLIILLYYNVNYTFNKKNQIAFLVGEFEVNFNQNNRSATASSITTHTDNQIMKQIVASVNGARYYYLHCGGVGRIKEENKVYFSNENEAEKAGYTLANNCQK